jgi:hypothetical protein
VIPDTETPSLWQSVTIEAGQWVRRGDLLGLALGPAAGGMVPVRWVKSAKTGRTVNPMAIETPEDCATLEVAS